MEGLCSKEDILPVKDGQIIIKSLLECIRFILVKKSLETSLVDFLLKTQVCLTLK